MTRILPAALLAATLGCRCIAPLALASEVTGTNDLMCADCHTREAEASSSPNASNEKSPISSRDDAKVSANGRPAATSEDSSPVETTDTPTLIEAHGTLSCQACHDDERLSALHDGVTADDKMPKKLKKSDVSEELCLKCHDSYEALATLTADSTLLTDENGTVVNPHALPEVADHDPITCISCHTAHGDKTLEEMASSKCLSCHHENVYECGTCH